jgi:hypothetical protein
MVAAAIVVRFGWESLREKRELAVEQAYAEATTPDQEKAFVAANPREVLAQVAELRLADSAYASGQTTEARNDYAELVGELPPGPLASRAQIGLAMAEIQSGEIEEGQQALRVLSNDPHQFMTARTEAIYLLASLAAASGRSEEVEKLSGQLMQLDPSSPWTERVFALEAGQIKSP